MNLILLIISVIISLSCISGAPQFQFQQQSSSGGSQQQQSNSFGGSSSQSSSTGGSSQQQFNNGTHQITVNQLLQYTIVKISDSTSYQPNPNSLVTFGNGTHQLNIYGDGRITIEPVKQQPFVPFTFAPFPTFAPFNFGK